MVNSKLKLQTFYHLGKESKKLGFCCYSLAQDYETFVISGWLLRKGFVDHKACCV